MAPKKRFQTAERYTIGWIAALEKELAAAEAMLDDVHKKPEKFKKHPRDTNNYVWGSIGDHNIVIASLAASKTGTLSAATTAASMTSSLPHLRFGLMVGIGAGIPRPADKIDIRLGDIVVSQPSGTSPGVVQYDLGKLETTGQVKRFGSLAPPPEVLLKGLATLKAKQRLRGSQVPAILQDMLQRYPPMAEAELQPDGFAFVHQGAENDRLFDTTSEHFHSLNEAELSTGGEHAGHDPQNTNDCARCDSTKEIKRKERSNTNPVVHYGVIASSNSVVKSSICRDEILERLDGNCICMEMEAAGLMDNFPCLVVRGICDYADSHKNDRWQNYAAAVAAAFTKELLQFLDGDDVEETPRMDEIMGKLCEDIAQVHETTKHTQEALRFQEVKSWLSAPDPSTNDNKALHQRHEGTGQWFLDSDTYSKWKLTPRSSSLWIYGIPGCGKTILSSIIIQDLRNTERCAKGLLYFYFDFTNHQKQSLEDVVRSFISQLYSKCEKTRPTLNSLHSFSKFNEQQPSLDDLCQTFVTMAQQTGDIWIVMDALDECQTRKGLKGGGLLSWISNLLKSLRMNTHLIVTSRPEHDIESAMRHCTDQQISLQSDLTAGDIRSYVKARVRCDEGLARWHSRKEIQLEIENHLIEKANGMFRWVSCQLDALEKCPDPLTLRRALKSLPSTLDETYVRIWEGIPPEFKQNALKLLQFLVFSESPLNIQEAVDVIAVVVTDRPRFDAINRMPQPDEITSYCSNLVVVTLDKTGRKFLQIAHFSVKEYLMSNRLERSIQEDFREPYAQAIVAETCLAYLLELKPIIELEETRRSFPLAQYAARYWTHHAARANASKVRGIIAEFVQNQGSYAICQQLLAEELGEFTPLLCLTASRGVLCAVEEILNNGADVNEVAVGCECGNALQAACSGGCNDIVHLLLERGADVQQGGGRFGTALNAASYSGQKEIIHALLEKGAELTATAESGATPLWYALGRNHLDTFKFLIQRGADITATFKSGTTLLHEASMLSRAKFLRTILDTGLLEPNFKQSFNGLTALSSLVSAADSDHEHWEEALQILFAEKNVDIGSKDNLGRTALFYASLRGIPAVTNALLERDSAVVNWKDYYGTSPLSAAARRGHVEGVKSLLAVMNVEIESRDWLGRTPLYWAKRCGHIEVSQLLVLNREQRGEVPVTDIPAIEPGRVSCHVLERWCDVCFLNIPREHGFYGCEVCNHGFGGYDVCLSCFRDGGSCLQPHVLVSRTGITKSDA